jgi:hypothetical protein
VTGFGVGVGRVKLELQNLVEKHREPFAKFRVEGIKEQVARAPVNRWLVAAAVTPYFSGGNKNFRGSFMHR